MRSAAFELASATSPPVRAYSHHHSCSVFRAAFSTTAPPAPPTRSARPHFRRRTSTFTPIDPAAVTVPASLVARINAGAATDTDNDDADDEAADDAADDAALIDRSLVARRTLFATLRQLQRMDAAELSNEYVDAIVNSLALHAPLLPRERLHIAALYAHVGRETEAVVHVGQLLREGHMTAEWAEVVRQSAERAALVGLEERMNRIVKTLKAGGSGSTTSAGAMANEMTATVRA